MESLRVTITPICHRTFNPWLDLAFVQAGAPFQQVSRHIVVTTDASTMGWGRCMQWASSLGLMDGNLATRQLWLWLQGEHMLLHTDNTAMVAYINYQPWSQQWLRKTCLPPKSLSVVLSGLKRAPFEPLGSIEYKILSGKTLLQTSLTYIKRLGDLQAVLVSESCLEFGQTFSHMILRTLPDCVLKCPTTPFGTRSSEQLFFCFGGQQKGKAVSKHKLPHWIVDDLEYQSQDVAYQSQDVAYQSQDVAYQSQDVVYQSQDVEYQSQDVAYQSQDVAYQPQDVFYQSQDVAYRSQDVVYRSQDVAYQSQDVVYRSQDIAYQSQDVACQSQDVAYQSQGVAYQSQDEEYQSQDVASQSQDVEYQSQDVASQSHDVAYQSQDVAFQSQDVAYQSQDVPCPLGVRFHSTRSVASSWALAIS
ncbi:hypothetical protein F2P79_016119 [Pimephales promelas]|nr:hypothetical protein F2P79_016119 [Pimephales promelas]